MGNMAKEIGIFLLAKRGIETEKRSDIVKVIRDVI
jgi:hypothetical protein